MRPVKLAAGGSVKLAAGGSVKLAAGGSVKLAAGGYGAAVTLPRAYRHVSPQGKAGFVAQ